ncbi:MAG: S-layer homology domain-containing protein [Bacillota bacterium]|nr:S-layer homology domain-containing protein [Bacillota bacterium]
MKRRRNLWVVGLVLLALLVPAGMAAAEDGLTDFGDTQNHWASEAIVQCRGLGLLSGYQGNVFKPKDQVSKAEAIVIIIRAMGLDGQAGTTDYSKVTFPAGVGKWCRGHIVLAAEKGMVSKDNIAKISWNAPATRLEVALWLAAGLKLGTDDSSLSFTDLGSVPAAYRPMLAAVVKKGVMTGTSATTFEPNKNLTRAEMASLLSKMLGSGYVALAPEQFVIGKLTIRDLVGKKITVETSAGTRTYDLAGSYLAFKGGKKVSLDVLPVGQNVKLVLSGAKKCIFIAYYGGDTIPAPAGNTYHGKVTLINTGSYPFMVFQPDTGASLSLPVAPNARVTVRGAASSLAAVQQGSTGTITVADGKVTAIDLDSGPAGSDLKGYVVNKFWDCFSIRYEDGTSEEIDINGLNFTKNGLASSYSALTRGTPVELVKVGTRVTGVIILNDARKVFGEVTRISSSRITIEDSDGYDHSYDLASKVVIKDRDGDSLDWDEIEVSDAVALTLDSDDEVTRIEVGVSASAREGIVDYIRTSGTQKIRIVNDDDDEYTYYIAEDVEVKEGSRKRALDDIDEGDRVRLTLNDDDEVIKIEILEAEGDTVEGTVTGLDLKREKITIKDKNGNKKTYYFDTDDVDMDNVLIGAKVKLTVDGDEVVDIEITNDEDLSGLTGVLTYVNTSSKYVRIKQDSGNEFKFYLASRVDLEDEDGDEIDLDDLKDYADDEPEVEFDLDGGKIEYLRVVD